MKIYISGLYSGTNPQPGVGIARSLRVGYPAVSLVGVEYSNRCSGIHWQDFDDIWLNLPWEDLNLELHARDIRNILDNGNLFISANDLEVLWLSEVFPLGHPNLLTPPRKRYKKWQNRPFPHMLDCQCASQPLSLRTFQTGICMRFAADMTGKCG